MRGPYEAAAARRTPKLSNNNINNRLQLPWPGGTAAAQPNSQPPPRGSRRDTTLAPPWGPAWAARTPCCPPVWPNPIRRYVSESTESARSWQGGPRTITKNERQIIKATRQSCNAGGQQDRKHSRQESSDNSLAGNLEHRIAAAQRNQTADQRQSLIPTGDRPEVAGNGAQQRTCAKHMRAPSPLQSLTRPPQCDVVALPAERNEPPSSCSTTANKKIK